MKTAYLFAGQGAQAVGMGKELYENHPAAQKLYQRANEILGFNLAQLCFEGPVEELNKTNICQPAILVTSLATLETVKEKHGKDLYAAAGLSLGEYTALVAVGAMDFDEAVKIVERRGTFMQEACDRQPGGMASIIALDKATVENICRSVKGILVIANLNCPGQIVISGEKSALAEACEKAKAAGAKRAIPLKVAGAFHSPLMQPAAEKLRAKLAQMNIKEPAIPVVTNVTADYVKDKDQIKNCLAKQVVSSVLWEDSIRRLIKDGVTTFYEIGPGNVLTGLMQRIDKTVQCIKV